MLPGEVTGTSAFVQILCVLDERCPIWAALVFGIVTG